MPVVVPARPTPGLIHASHPCPSGKSTAAQATSLHDILDCDLPLISREQHFRTFKPLSAKLSYPRTSASRADRACSHRGNRVIYTLCLASVGVLAHVHAWLPAALFIGKTRWSTFAGPHMFQPTLSDSSRGCLGAILAKDFPKTHRTSKRDVDLT
jgi:hypothetical protein